MEIITLLKANIRRKRGSFVSILLLTAIVSAVMTTIFSVRDNYNTAINHAVEYAHSGDIMAIIRKEALTDELRIQVENHPLVERVVYYDAIYTHGLHCNENYDASSQFMLEMREGMHLLNENLDGYTDNIPELKSGEIYLPLTLKSELACNVGDTITIDIIKGTTAEFIIKGFVEEITLGSMEIGWKQIFISHEDYVRILDKCQTLATADITLETFVMMIHKTTDCDLSAAKFQRKLNLDTGIISTAMDSFSIDLSIYYTKLRIDTVLNIVMVFALFLLIIVPIVMSHNIETDIEIEYTILGILKAQGFTPNKIRFLLTLQYVLAQIAGSILGSIVSIPLEHAISKACMSITGIFPASGLAIEKYLLLVAAILVASIVLIYFKTTKISKISPVRAISVGHEEIFFNSRMNLPITKKGLSASLSFRQFTSTPMHYIGSVFIVALLTFCMITTNLLGNMLASRNALDAMGITIPDISLYYYTSSHKSVSWKKLDVIIDSHTAITKKNSYQTISASLNGEELICEVYEFPEYISGIIKGRAPLYNNEIMITETVADLLDLQMGDEVTITFNATDNPFIISGIYQGNHKSGRTFLMNFKGAERNGYTPYHAYRYYVIENKETLTAIADEITEKYGNILEVEITDADSPAMAEYSTIVSLLKLIVYTFSLLFSMVVVRMVCTQTFVQERTNIGIYKALGFTANTLRLQFAARFFIIAVIGSVLGIVLSMLFSPKMLSILFSAIGLSKVVFAYTAISLFIPMAVISLSFFLFAYISSNKIKKVSVRELIVE